MKYQTHMLDNGLRIIHYPYLSEISYCGFAVNTGTRDEMPDEEGMAHFVEHMLFKGTKRRKSLHIANRMENVGGEINAYTTKEETFVYSIFPEEYLPRAVDLLSDMVFHSTFDQIQIEREQGVVLDEINSYLDTPADLIYDDFENLLFSGHDLGHYILGNPQSLKTFDTQRLKNFVERQYNPALMVFFSFGKSPFSKVVKQVEKHLAGIPANGILSKKREIPTDSSIRKERVAKGIMQAHVMMGRKTYDMYHPDRYALYLLNNILGGNGMNSRLNVALREKNGLVYNVESSVSFYTDTGVFALYFACDPRHMERCVQLVENELQRLKETRLTPGQLATAKKQLKGQMMISAENHENVALDMAKNFLHYHEYRSPEETLKIIDSVTSVQLQQVATEVFDLSMLSQLCYV
ncbi:M16 family metallopeptidase [Anaerorudis cellulosivorans]|uniref:M16 family metallopeptidase n=1 Tax=Anaerorudis cellulosivorans TaxID=3397862 RepID=UPI00222073DD|nr:pitrilysin family protein [Seramator thermalis]MCW1734508.1 insulinase family protein [Seramator thermalis]